MIRMFRLAVAAGWLCLAACQPAPDANGTASPPSTTGAAANPATDAMPPPAAGEPAAAPTFAGGDDYDQYACDAGVRLIRNDDGSFRAEVPGNAPVRLSRITGSDPAVFTGSSLYLRIGPDGTAILSQGDRTNELRCSAGQAHA
jgi:hypothetical protein